MKRITSFIIAVLFISFIFPSGSWGQNDSWDTEIWDAEITRKIIRPWRSTTEIVKPGESFQVWFNADAGQEVLSVRLEGPYSRITCTDSVSNGDWEFDPLSGNRYNTRITVTVPPEAPADRYDLVLETSTGDEVSWGGVKIIKEYKDNYYLMHFSDGHIFQSAGEHDSEVLLARKSAMIDMANIMDVPIIIETGDNMYNIRNNPEHEFAFYLGIPSINIKGLTDANAATFLCPGNHDAHTANVWDRATVEVNSDWWNTYYGLQNSSFKYGNSRFMLLNNGWDWREHQYQAHKAGEWLNGDGAGGNFFLSAAHHYDKMHNIIDGYEPLNLVLAGHKHYASGDNPWTFTGGKDAIAYIAGSIRDKFEFNLFRVNNTTGEYIPVAGSTGVVQVLNSGDKNDRSTWEPNLTLSYSADNDGSATMNTATIVNKFDFPIMGARVRFVMPKGADFQIVNASVIQHFEGDLFQVVDVKTDVPANGTKMVYLNGDVDLCPDDPNKTDPGLCGCGVPEGECETSALIVNDGIGDGDYLPLQNATIIADQAPQGQVFDAWEIVSGNPFIYDLNAPFTEVRLEGEPAEISATYKDIPIVLVNQAVFFSQYIPPVSPGEKVNVSLTMKNTGTSSWTKESGHNLGSQNPQDNTTWGFTRVSLDVNDSIEPGAEKTFHYEITAPGIPGTYKFQWQMLQEKVEWFGAKSNNQFINIGGNSDYIDYCDALTGWETLSNISLDSTNQKQGEGCLVFTGNTNDEFKKVFTDPFNIVGTQADAMLEFWYYVSDVSSRSDLNQVELGSGGKADVDEYNWNLTGLVDGWNYIRLKVSEAGKTGNPDLSSINWFRVYSLKSGSITTMIDGIKITGMNTSLNVNTFNPNGKVRVYPNPVYNDGVSVEFDLNAFSKVSVSVLDINGSIVMQPFYNHSFDPGMHKVNIPVYILPGTYFLQITSDGFSQTHKIIVM